MFVLFDARKRIGRMLVTSSIISVAMSQFLSRNLAPPCCGPASSLVSYTERNRVSGFPGGFPPPFQASLLCTARNSANDLCTPNIQPTFRSETAYRGPLDLKYSIQEDFERSLFRKWLESSQGRKKSAGRISILSAFAISFKASYNINTRCLRSRGTNCKNKV